MDLGGLKVQETRELRVFWSTKSRDERRKPEWNGMLRRIIDGERGERMMDVNDDDILDDFSKESEDDEDNAAEVKALKVIYPTISFRIQLTKSLFRLNTDHHLRSLLLSTNCAPGVPSSPSCSSHSQRTHYSRCSTYNTSYTEELPPH
jgi:hypothetical protein